LIKANIVRYNHNVLRNGCTRRLAEQGLRRNQMNEFTEQEAIECGFSNAAEAQASWEANRADQQDEWVAAEIAQEQRFSQWLAFPGNR
jgi:hypothetical protein